MNPPNNYTFTRKEIREFARKDQYAMLMFNHAGDDYVGARCLIVNGLLVAGFPLVAQSVEKFLKALIFFQQEAHGPEGQGPPQSFLAEKKNQAIIRPWTR